MMRKHIISFAILGLALVFLLKGSGLATDSSTIDWKPWSESAFQQAKKEHKLVILDLEAVWCHWCHVMDEKTYHNPKVAKIINEHYIALRVDQDSRPDLSNRYMDYGWPATIFFNADGKELVKRAGYIEPKEMSELLQAIIKDPTPETTDNSDDVEHIQQFAASPYLDSALQKKLLADYVQDYDAKYGGWSIGEHKFLDWDSAEYAISKAKAGDVESAKMAQKSLEGERNLLDPVWGGLYQYSTDGDWVHPHFERIMLVQTENLTVYTEAYALWHTPAYLQTARAVYHFLDTFLKDPNGAYYTSMDADLIQGQHSADYFKLDDTGRRAQGIPRIDKHQYARENGCVVPALCALYAVTGDETYLKEAITAANWVIQNRSLPDGGFRHDDKDLGGPYLGDTLYMGRAFLNLYQATGNRDWLAKAEQAAQFIDSHFKLDANKPGYASAVVTNDIVAAKPIPLRDENAVLVRFANNLYHATGQEKYLTIAKTAMRFVATPGIADQPFTATTLLAESELTQDPTHITVVGHKDDPAAIALYKTALKYPAVYKRLDLWDKREGPMPNPDVQYPELEQSAAFVCTNSRCSLPVFQPDALTALVNRLTTSKSK